jgi:phosphate-selective porin OprO and OprP
LSRIGPIGLALVLCVFPVAAARAQQRPSLEDRIEVQQQENQRQREQLEDQAKQLEELRKQVEEQRNEDEHAKDERVDQLEQEVQKQKIAAQDAPKLTFVAGRPTITSADGRSWISLRAVVQLDAAHYEQKDEDALMFDFRRGSVGANQREVTSAVDLSDGAYFRRARMGFEGAFSEDFNFRFLAEFGGSGTEGPARINDAWVSFVGFAPFTLQAGAFTPSANLEDATSQEELMFPERATPAELSRTLGGADGRIGVALRSSGQRWMNSIAFTTRTVADAEAQDSSANLVGRIALLALTGSDYNVHTGINGTYTIKPADAGKNAPGARYAVRFRDRPELRVDSTRLIDTGSIDAHDAWNAGVEFAANWRYLYVQGEYMLYGIDRVGAADNPDFNGGYVQAGWFLTGESRRYNMATGSFQMPRPFVPVSWHPFGYGAWELAARYSHTDLDFRPGHPGTLAGVDAVRGGVQDIVTLGINWYLNSNFRMSVNAYFVDVERLNPASAANLQPFGAPPGTPPIGVEIGQNYWVIGWRSQFMF